VNIFALISLPQVKGKIRFCKLEIDGICPFDEFCEAIANQGNLEKQLKTIYGRMDQVANLKLLPKEKFKDITPSKEPIKEFEIKTRDLRVYLIKDENGHIIIVGGKKNSQGNDISTFRSIKKKYLFTKTQKS